MSTHAVRLSASACSAPPWRADTQSAARVASRELGSIRRRAVCRARLTNDDSELKHSPAISIERQAAQSRRRSPRFSIAQICVGKTRSSAMPHPCIPACLAEMPHAQCRRQRSWAAGSRSPSHQDADGGPLSLRCASTRSHARLARSPFRLLSAALPHRLANGAASVGHDRGRSGAARGDKHAPVTAEAGQTAGYGLARGCTLIARSTQASCFRVKEGRLPLPQPSPATSHCRRSRRPTAPGRHMGLLSVSFARALGRISSAFSPPRSEAR